MSVRRALAVAAALPLLLAGCSEGEAEPKMPDPSPSSSSSTPTAEPTAEQETPEEFVRRWQKTADAMVTSGDTSEFRAISKGCRACADYADRIDAAYEGGGQIRFGGSKVESIKTEAEDPPTLVVQVKSAELRIVTPGEEPQVFPAAQQTYRMTLARKRDAWIMRHYGVL